nr:MAG TPA: hypothetical protein [Caudoviricetes sp.]
MDLSVRNKSKGVHQNYLFPAESYCTIIRLRN